MAREVKTFTTTFAGRELTVETGRTSELTNGSCWVRYGETVVMANVTASAKPREGVDFFPLSVDYEEKLYAVGKIPGSFLKREGRPTEKAILTSRMIDRPIRPLFPKDMRNDVSVVVHCACPPITDCSPEIAGYDRRGYRHRHLRHPLRREPDRPASASAMVDGEIVINPTAEQRAKSDMDRDRCGHRRK